MAAAEPRPEQRAWEWRRDLPQRRTDVELQRIAREVDRIAGPVSMFLLAHLFAASRRDVVVIMEGGLPCEWKP